MTMTAKTVTEDWPYEQLQEEADGLRKRLNHFRASLGRYFVAESDGQIVASLTIIYFAQQMFDFRIRSPEF